MIKLPKIKKLTYRRMLQDSIKLHQTISQVELLLWYKQCEIIDTVNKLINSLGEK